METTYGLHCNYNALTFASLVHSFWVQPVQSMSRVYCFVPICVMNCSFDYSCHDTRGSMVGANKDLFQKKWDIQDI